MTSDEVVVTSFVGEDEQLRGTWTATKVDYSKGQLPPMTPGEEVVAVTDERVLWFEDELEAVPLESIDEVEREHVEHQAAPPMVLGGGLLFVLGVFGSIGAFFATAGGPLVVAMPALTGLLVFVLAAVVARLTGREGQSMSGHRLRLWTGDDPVSIWSDEAEPVESLHDAITTQVGQDVATGDQSTGDDVLIGAGQSDADQTEPVDTGGDEAAGNNGETDTAQSEVPSGDDQSDGH